MMEHKLIQYLSSFATPERIHLFHQVLKSRTSYLTVVLEDVFQPQNASAVLRTCDCFGIQHVHIIENRNEFTVDREVAMGASKWLTIHKHNRKKENSRDALRYLKAEGYRIIATSPHENDLTLPDFDVLKGKAAIVFGSELPGISEVVEEEADEFLKIPMFGFTESFNISVSAAVVLYELTKKLREYSELVWGLTDSEKCEILLHWLRSSIKKSDLLEKWFIGGESDNANSIV